MVELAPDELAYQRAHIDQNLGPTITIVCAIFASLSLIATALRFLSQLRNKARLQHDDWLCIPSLVRGTL